MTSRTRQALNALVAPIALGLSQSLPLSEAKWRGQPHTLKEMQRALKSLLSRFEKSLAKAEDMAGVEALLGKARTSLSEYEVRWVAHPDAFDLHAGMPASEIARLEALSARDREQASQAYDAASRSLQDLAAQRKAEISKTRDARSAQLDRERRDRGAGIGGYEKELELMRLSRR